MHQEGGREARAAGKRQRVQEDHACQGNRECSQHDGCALQEEPAGDVWSGECAQFLEALIITLCYQLMYKLTINQLNF